MSFEEQKKPLRTRRDFLRTAGCAAMGTMALSSTLRDLRLINAAVAQTNVTGYKALVCLFLNGGNDANNWIVPTDASTYADYASIRGILALPQSSLLGLHTGPSAADPSYFDSDGHSYGFHPTCPELQTLFGEGKLTSLFNVGTLVRPITRADFLANTTGSRPPQLFSHSDQVTQWQTSIPDQAPITGWGGRVADLLNATSNPSGQISMSVSLNGINTFEVGNIVSQYQISTAGAITLGGSLMGSTAGNSARARTFKDITGLPHPNLQRTAYADVLERAIATGELLNAAIASTATATDVPAGTFVWNTPFPNTGTGNQLKMIARTIAARGPAAFNMSRQIFFCSIGGFDTHTSQVTLSPLNPLTGTHTNLLNEVSEAMYAFQRAMEQLGVPDSVTTFTASDFSRTLPTNSQGSDHGWGSHHVIMGGAVNGHRTYGRLPEFTINGPDDTGTGRWIPTTSVDQYSATLAKWFGVDPGNMGDVFPNLNRFPSSDLGFML
jgi:uncharacterized protein (DUF1501 family)